MPPCDRAEPMKRRLAAVAILGCEFGQNASCGAVNDVEILAARLVWGQFELAEWLEIL
jgi:hypothetical protein